MQEVLRVAVDFDHCLIEDIPSMSENYTLRENALHTINTLSKQGVVFVLNTSRYGWYYDSAVKFINEQGLDLVVEQHENKVPADVYIDDCNIDVVAFQRPINWYRIELQLTNILKRRKGYDKDTV